LLRQTDMATFVQAGAYQVIILTASSWRDAAPGVTLPLA
jgi:hypothetical protein